MPAGHGRHIVYLYTGKGSGIGASSDGRYGSFHGDQSGGTATTPEEVGQLNTANTVSITYNNGNGQINGALRILITLTLIALAPTIIIMMSLFYEDHHRAAFYQVCTEYPDGTAEPDPDRTGTDPDIFHYGAYDHEDQ